MQALAIIEPFDERKELPARVVPGVIRLVMDQFILQGAEEALCHRIIEQFPLRLMLGVMPSVASRC